MQKTIDISALDWARGQKVNVQSRGIASIVVPQLKAAAAGALKSRPRCVWPSGFENVDSRFLSRRVWGK